MHRIPLDISSARSLQLHRHSRKHAARDPLPLGRAADPRADGGADLSIPRSAGRTRHPRRRTGTAGVCLEVDAVRATRIPMRSKTICLYAFAFLFLTMAPAAIAQDAIADYRRKLAEYQAAHDAYEADAGAYWSSIAEKRRGRNAKRRERQAVTLDDYVLTQPPVYSGPKRPVNPQPEPEATPPPAKNHSGGRRSPEGGVRHFPVGAAAAGVGGRLQARLRPLRHASRADARAGGAGLCVRDRRQRQSRHAVGTELVAAGRARDLDRDRLQPAAHHQQRRADRRAGPAVPQGA